MILDCNFSQSLTTLPMTLSEFTFYTDAQVLDLGLLSCNILRSNISNCRWWWWSSNYTIATMLISARWYALLDLQRLESTMPKRTHGV